MDITFEPINITKELILTRIPEERILEHYLGVPVKKGLFINPLRNDKRPTCSFYKSKTSGRIIMKDFAGYFCGDFVSVVMYKFQCSFYKALQIIANDFGIIHRTDIAKNKPKLNYTGSKFEESTEAIIQVELRN